MISTESFSKDWIIQRSQELKYNNKQLLEKVIRAFSLLEALVENGAPIIFKGGSSLLLILKDNLNRLSIDIDVICPPDVDIREYLKNLDKHGFQNIIPVNPENGGKNLPASHFKSYYDIIFSGRDDDEAYIRLDVLNAENPYHNTITLPIESPFFKQDGEPLMVQVPAKEDILGDKLTAFGPNTLGIPYFKREDLDEERRRCSLEIIKQLFDIGCLFNSVTDFSNTFNSFLKVSTEELSFRPQMEGRIEKYFDDVRQSALCLSTRGQIGEGKFEEFQDGLIRIKNYMYQRNYYIEQAIVDAAKAAYLATCFEHGINDIQKYNRDFDLHTLAIFANMPKELQRFRRSSPEAFWYWAKTYELL